MIDTRARVFKSYKPARKPADFMNHNHSCEVESSHPLAFDRGQDGACGAPSGWEEGLDHD